MRVLCNSLYLSMKNISTLPKSINGLELLHLSKQCNMLTNRECQKSRLICLVLVKIISFSQDEFNDCSGTCDFFSIYNLYQGYIGHHLRGFFWWFFLKIVSFRSDSTYRLFHFGLNFFYLNA